jgi:hypothetical protein
MGYAIRAMSFADILGTGVRVVRDHARLLIGTAALLYVPMAVLDSLAFSVAATPSWPLWAASALVHMIVGPVVFCAITFAVGELYLGRATSTGPSLRAGLAVLGPMNGTLFVYYTLLGLAALAFLVPALYLLLAWALVWQVMLLEGRFGLAALRRSRELMQGHKLRGGGVMLVSAALVIVLGGVVHAAIGHIPIVGPIGRGLAEAMGVAYGSTLAVVLYFDVRARREAFDLAHLAHDIERVEPPRAA